jgi:hypothetical protein
MRFRSEGNIRSRIAENERAGAIDRCWDDKGRVAETRKIEVDEMVEACRPTLEHYGETPEEVVEELVASLREFLEYWHSKTWYCD